MVYFLIVPFHSRVVNSNYRAKLNTFLQRGLLLHNLKQYFHITVNLFQFHLDHNFGWGQDRLPQRRLGLRSIIVTTYCSFCRPLMGDAPIIAWLSVCAIGRPHINSFKLEHSLRRSRCCTCSLTLKNIHFALGFSLPSPIMRRVRVLCVEDIIGSSLRLLWEPRSRKRPSVRPSVRPCSLLHWPLASCVQPVEC